MNSDNEKMDSNVRELTDDDRSKIAGGADRHDGKQGLICPQCGEFIPTTIAEMMTASVLKCPHCLLQLRIDRNRSSAALRALEKVDASQRKLDTSAGCLR